LRRRRRSEEDRLEHVARPIPPGLSRKEFDDVVQMLAEASTRRGRRSRIHYDGINKKLRDAVARGSPPSRRAAQFPIWATTA
jgi:hypothetical protein